MVGKFVEPWVEQGLLLCYGANYQKISQHLSLNSRTESPVDRQGYQPVLGPQNEQVQADFHTKEAGSKNAADLHPPSFNIASNKRLVDACTRRLHPIAEP